MWLLHTENIHLRLFPSPPDVSYAILSHVWGEDEQTFQDTPRVQPNTTHNALRRARDHAFSRPSLKIRNACARARRDGFRWLWVDTCCIDKTNSTELSEAINSMFEWYRNAAMCYAFLDDVPRREDSSAPTSAFRSSMWFKRGWTLQELIAPHSVIFLTAEWEAIGPKWRLASLIEKVTGIDRAVLTHKRSLKDFSLACRMSWAAGRKTCRVEDEAYSLMGLFGVYMPTIYGEGKHAFIRLQEEIVKKSPDQSIFAWGRTLQDYSCGRFVEIAQEHDYEPQSHLETLLAPSPACFASCGNINPISQWEFATRLEIQEFVPEYTNTSFGIRTTFPMISVAQTSSIDAALGLLACEDGQGRLVALYLRSHPRKHTSTKFYVGGYIARGGRCNDYYRATRLSLPAVRDCTARQSSGKCDPIAANPVLREVHVHSHPDIMTRLRVPRAESESGSATSSMVFFEPPCTVVLSQRCVERLRELGYIGPNIPEKGFRLESPGDYRSISFLGHEAFTVHLGVCPLDLSTSTQSSQLWACVRFDADLNSLLGESTSRVGPPSDVIPDESMLVQSWRHGRATFGSRGKQVRLTFNYPCRSTAEISMVEVYELDIRYDGEVVVQRPRLRRVGTSSIMTKSSRGKRSVSSKWTGMT